MPEKPHVVFVGPMLEMNKWMGLNGYTPFDAGRLVHLALNGPEQIRGLKGPIKVVHHRGWVPPEGAWSVDATLTLAAAINGTTTGER